MSEGPGRSEAVSHHPAVRSAAVTFCLGLMLVRLALAVWYPARLGVISGDFGDPLLVLTGLCVACTLVYLILRREEGDFQALFLAALAVFAAEEVCFYLSRVTALRVFEDLGVPAAFATAVYCLLAFAAAAYDGPLRKGDLRRVCGLAATGAMLALALLRALASAGQTWSRDGSDDLARLKTVFHIVGLAVLAVAAAYLVYNLLRWPPPGGTPTEKTLTAANQPPASSPLTGRETPPGGPGQI